MAPSSSAARCSRSWRRDPDQAHDHDRQPADRRGYRLLPPDRVAPDLDSRLAGVPAAGDFPGWDPVRGRHILADPDRPAHPGAPLDPGHRHVQLDCTRHAVFPELLGLRCAPGVAYRVAGLPGVALLCAVITAGIVALALAVARTLGASAAAAAVVFFLSLPLLAGWLSARPQLVDYAAVLALALLLRGIERGRGRWGAAALAGLLTATWINLHAAALLAVAVAAASAVLLLLLARRDARWRYAAAAALAAAAGCLANPHGIGVLHQASQVHADSTQLVTEWMPFDPANVVQDLTLAAGIAALIIAWRRREAVMGAALVICMAGSIQAVRFLPFVVILAMPVLASFASNPPAPMRRYLVSRRVMLQRGGALGFAALVALAVTSLTHIGRPEPATYPVTVVAAIPHGCRLFTNDLIGAYVILARPDVPVSLDTRNNLYGPKLLIAEERV